MRLEPSGIVSVTANDLPLATLSGEMWHLPVSPARRGCLVCALEAECHERQARGDFIACERLIFDDLFPEDRNRLKEKGEKREMLG